MQESELNSKRLEDDLNKNIISQKSDQDQEIAALKIQVEKRCDELEASQKQELSKAKNEAEQIKKVELEKEQIAALKRQTEAAELERQ